MISRVDRRGDEVERRQIHPGQCVRLRRPGLDRPRVFLAAVALALAGTPVAGSAQAPGRVSVQRPATSSADSASLRQEAHSAQRMFEAARVRHLPLGWSGGGWDCDEIVGRMCWRHDAEDDDDGWTAPPEAVQIHVARDTLLLRLDRIGERIPADDWVLGQRVWYYGEAGRWGEALGLAQDCRGGHLPWCAALRGLALHQLGRYRDAALAFDDAEAALAERRTADEAVRLLLDGDARDWLDDGREEVLWALSDPLFGVVGNDRLTEHHARRVVDLIRRRARNPYGLSWGDDTAELQIRYGWEAGWERDQSRSFGSIRPHVVGHHAPRSRRFVPPGVVLRSPATADTAELAPLRRRPQSTYAPPYVWDIEPATGQVLNVLRGEDGFEVWAVLDEPPPTEAGDEAGAVSPVRSEPAGQGSGPASPSSDERSPVGEPGGFALDLGSLEIRRADSLAPGVFGLRVPYGEHVLSVEEWDPGPRPEVRRLRRGLRVDRIPADVVAISDLILLSDGPLPERLEDAPARLLRRPPAPGDTVVVAWTVHGLGFDGFDLRYALTTEEEAGGFLRRFGRWIRVVGEESSVLTEWTEPPPPDPGVLFRSVRLVLPEWEDGDHVMTLSLRVLGRAPVLARSVLRLEGRDGR